MLPIDGKSSICAPAFNPQNPATWLKPDEALIGADGRDWSWAYVWFVGVPDFPGYKAEWHGTVWSCRDTQARLTAEWRRMKPSARRNSGMYPDLCLSRDGRKHRWRLSRLMLTAFVGPCPPGMECCHRNDNKFDNRLCNLEWGTKAHNYRQRSENGRTAVGVRNGRALLTPNGVAEAKRLHASGWTIAAIARRLGRAEPTIRDIIKGRRWKCLNPCPPQTG